MSNIGLTMLVVGVLLWVLSFAKARNHAFLFSSMGTLAFILTIFFREYLRTQASWGWVWGSVYLLLSGIDIEIWRRALLVDILSSVEREDHPEKRELRISMERDSRRLGWTLFGVVPILFLYLASTSGEFASLNWFLKGFLCALSLAHAMRGVLFVDSYLSTRLRTNLLWFYFTICQLYTI